jgi:hypothetical protein
MNNKSHAVSRLLVNVSYAATVAAAVPSSPTPSLACSDER